MKKLTTQILPALIFCFGFSLAVIGTTTVAATSLADSLSIQKTEAANYLLGRHVIGSGGVIGAKSPNYVHHGTAGQTIIGGVQGANNILVSGFWILPAGPTEVNPEEKLNLPTSFILHQNHPNPFNPETAIEYDLPNVCLVMVEIFNTVGQRIRLVSSQVQGPGRATAVWDGRDDQRKALGSGVYFYRVTAFAVNNTESNFQIKFQQTKKMLLVK